MSSPGDTDIIDLSGNGKGVNLGDDFFTGDFNDTILLSRYGIIADGVTVNSAALVNALDVVATTRGQHIVYPRGLIRFDAGLVIGTSHAVEGYGQGTDGKATTNLLFPYGCGKAVQFKSGGVGDAGAQRGSLRNLRIDFDYIAPLLSGGTGTFNTGSPNTISVVTGAGNFFDKQFIALEGAGQSLTVQDRTVAMTNGSNIATVADPLNTGSNPGVYVGQPVTIAGAGVAGANLVGFVGTWGPTTFTVVNAAGAALNASTTVSASAYTIVFPIYGEIIAGGSTSTLTISTPFNPQNVTAGVLRHMDCGVFASCTIDMQNVEIEAHGSAGILSAGGNCDLFLYGIAGEGTSADNSQFFNVKTGSNLAFAGLIAYGNDAQAMSFHGCNFAGPKTNIDNSFLGNSFHGCHWAFNVGLAVVLPNAATTIHGGYMEDGTSYIAPANATCSFYGTTGMVNASGWQGISKKTGNFALPTFTAATGIFSGDIIGGKGLCSKGTGTARFCGDNSGTYPVGSSGITGVSVYYNSARDSGIVAADDGSVYKVLELVGSKIQVRPANVATGEWDNTLGGLNLLSGKKLFNNSVQVLGARATGWTAATGTATRTTFATGSVTLSVLAEHVKALTDDLIAHGLIGA